MTAIDTSPKSMTPARTFMLRLAAGVLSINLIVIALASVSIYQSWRYNKERVEIQGQNLSQALEMNIEGTFDKTYLALKSVVNEAEKELAGGGIDDQALNMFISQQNDGVWELDGLRMTDAAGNVVYGTGVVPGSVVNIADRDYYIKARDINKPELFITKPVFGRIANKWVLIIARRVNNPDGSFAGVAYGALPIDYFRDLFSSFDIGRQGSITLRDGDLAVIARFPEPNGTGSTTGYKLVTPEFQEQLKMNSISGKYTAHAAIDNIERMYFYRKISSYPLYINVGRATSDYLAGWLRETAQILALVAFFVIGTLVSAWLIYRSWIGEKQAHEDLYRYQEHLQELVKERTTELENANLELEAFNYTVSHDLRKPITVIKGYCDLIQEFCGRDLKTECREYLKVICDGADNMNRLIDALLEFSCLTQAEIHRETVDLSRIANAVAAELLLTDTGRHVTFRIAESMTADTDANLLRVVLDNLIGNAWKYTGKTEEAIIEIGMTEVEGQPTYFIRDNGTGFDMAHAGKLFMPFKRLPGADVGGHGIGLATVERIINRLGGKVWAEGELGKGATFYFTL